MTGMGLEQTINYHLNKHPALKRGVKRAYQRAMVALTRPPRCRGPIVRLSPDDPTREYFFGYYDKSPWDATGRHVLCHRAADTWSAPDSTQRADILLIDTDRPESDPDRVRAIAATTSWNVQQGCMLQWLGPDFSSRILYNDFRSGRFVSVVHDIATGGETLLSAPVYTVSSDGTTALTLDFTRLHNLRPGYGYANLPETTQDVPLPDAPAVWKIDIPSATVTPLLSYKNFASFHPRPEMRLPGAVHKVNHLMLSPDGKRFMVLYRWFVGQRKYTRLITCNTDGSGMYLLSDDDMVSHCFWKDDSRILAFENKRSGGPGYYLMTDRTADYRRCWPELSGDGHPSYSPDGNAIVTDSYPDRARVQSLFLMSDENSPPVTLARVFSPFRYDNDTRCDLHPRWNHTGSQIAFDAVFEGHRGLYLVPARGPHTPEEGPP